YHSGACSVGAESATDPARVGRILGGRLEAGAAEEPVGEDLPELDAGLVERIDVVERTCVDGRDLERHDELAERVRIEARESEGHVHAAVGGERAGRGGLLGAEEVAERVAAEVVELVD